MRNKSLFLNKETNEHVTPYMCVKGYSGSSALRSALDAINEIPEHVVHSTWLAGVVGESKRVTASLAEHLQEQADAVVRKQGEHERVVRFHIGDMVLVKKPFYERGTGLVLPQYDGPYVVQTVKTHSVTLADPLTDLPAFQGHTVATSRLVTFNYPTEHRYSDLVGTSDLEISPGDFIAVEVMASKMSKVYVAMVLDAYSTGDQVRVRLYEVTKGERYGPWERRPWSPVVDAAGTLSEPVLGKSDVLCHVALTDSALTAESLTRLSAAGVSLPPPTREKTLPGRTRGSAGPT